MRAGGKRKVKQVVLGGRSGRSKITVKAFRNWKERRKRGK